jgi:large subunit ribosomal protein L32e
MAKITPLKTKTVIHKRTKKFLRHQSDVFKRLDAKHNPGWRKPKGIDGRVRRKFKGAIPMPSVGYGTDKKTRNILPNGFKKVLVSNLGDLSLLLMHNRTYCAEVAHNVSMKKRKEIVKRAEELGVKVMNAGARLKADEEE